MGDRPFSVVLRMVPFMSYSNKLMKKQTEFTI
jgi:hypothetical protein